MYGDLEDAMMKICVDVLYERFHVRRGTPLDSRLREDSEVHLSVDEKSAKMLIVVKTLTSKDTYSSRDVSVSDFDEAKGSISVVMRDKHCHCALTLLSRKKEKDIDSEEREISRLEEFRISVIAACRQVISLAQVKDKEEAEGDENFNNSNNKKKHYKDASPSVHAPKERVADQQRYARSGLTPMKKKVRDTATPQKLLSRSGSCTENTEALKLANEQKAAISSALNGENIFVTGGGGTGKSTLLENLISRLRSKVTKGVFVTATTGMSACAIGGVTIHQFGGLSQQIDENDCPVERMQQIADDIKSKKSAVVQRWRDCSVLIIDEVSMLGRKVFETLDVIAREVRDIDKPFGDIQVIFVGDFFQLPPVVRPTGERDRSAAASDGFFCFQSPLWKKLIHRNHVLQHVFRQKEHTFVKALEDIRQGKWTETASDLLDNCIDRELEDPPVHLFTHRVDVDRTNQAEIGCLAGKERKYRAVDKSSSKSGGGAYLRMLQNSTPAPESLILKLDARIILTKNLDVAKGLMNGARGVVSGFTSSSGGLPVVTFDSGETKTLAPVKHKIYLGNVEVASRTQLPCCLGWAMSIHKAQGMSIDSASLHLRHVFEFGMTYVALSRARSLNKLQLDCRLDEARVKAHPKVIEFYKQMNHKEMETLE